MKRTEVCSANVSLSGEHLLGKGVCVREKQTERERNRQQAQHLYKCQLFASLRYFAVEQTCQYNTLLESFSDLRNDPNARSWKTFSRDEMKHNKNTVHGEVDKRQVSAIPLPLKTCQVILTLSGSSRGESTLTTRRPQYPECFSVL